MKAKYKPMTLKEALERMLFLAEDKLARAKERYASAVEKEKALDKLAEEWNVNHYEGDVDKIMKQLEQL